MNLLVIGGSQFVGRHLVDAAAARGDGVTVFNRGRTRTRWPDGVEVGLRLQHFGLRGLRAAQPRRQRAWQRAADGEAVLAPGARGDGLQFIDVRDLVYFTLSAIDVKRSGAFNLTSPPRLNTFGGLLDACAAAANTRPAWHWADAAALERCGLKAWSDLPVWLPATGELSAFALTDTRAAEAAGLRIRALFATVADTLAWYRSLAPEQQVFDKAGLSAEREAEALRCTGMR